MDALTIYFSYSIKEFISSCLITITLTNIFHSGFMILTRSISWDLGLGVQFCLQDFSDARLVAFTSQKGAT